MLVLRATPHGEKQPSDVGIEVNVKELLGDSSKGSAPRDAGIGKQNVDLPVLLLHFVVQPVEIREVCDVSAYSRLSRSALRQIQSVLATTSNEDVRGESVTSGQPAATGAFGDNSHFPL